MSKLIPDRIAEIAMQHDFYSELLTEKQNDVIDMYIMQNLSLSEISDELGISRQAVSILINRTEKKLSYYENKLHLVENHLENKKKSSFIVNQLDSISNSQETSEETKKKLSKITTALIDLISDILPDILP